MTSSSTTEAAAATSFYNPGIMQEQHYAGMAEHASISSSTTGAAAVSSGALASAVGGTYVSYSNTEFTAWEDILLDMTAWMIAIVLCYDPTRGLEEDKNDEEWEKDMQEDARRRFGIKRKDRNQSHRIVEQQQDDDNDNDHNSHDDDHKKEDQDKHCGN
jgi:hypothetical protein